MPQPHERVAIITGAASGIGLALTKHLLGKNYKVFMADLNPNGPSIASSLTGSPSPTFIHTDVSSWDAQAALFKTASSHSGSIDFFAANAGIDDKENVFQDFGDDEPKCPNLKTLDVDLLSVFYGLKLFVHYARKSRRQGLEGVRKMVITASMMGIYPFETNPQYCAAKHGLVGLTRSVGPKFAKEGITVNAIMPAFVPTGLAPEGLIEAVEEKGHLTPISSILKAYDALIDDDGKSGETVEVTLDELHFRKPVEFPNESQRWLSDDPEGFWTGAYGKKRADKVAG